MTEWEVITVLNIDVFESQKCDVLRRFGFPLDELWLTECEQVDNQTGVVYYHESGNVYGLHSFTDQSSFEAACYNLVHSVYGEEGPHE